MKRVFNMSSLFNFKTAILATMVALVGCQSNSPISLSEKLEKRSILWNIVNERCGTEKDAKQDCLVTDREQGFVIFRDRHGPVQTLTMPTLKITGVEDKQLLAPQARNYFYDAWQSRAILDQQNQKPIDPQYLSFSVNSSYGRSQDQLHIHNSCLRKDVYQIVEKNRIQLTNEWTVLPEKVFGHTYIAQKIKLADLEQTSPFKNLETYVNQQKKANMGQFGVAIVSAKDGEIVFLASQVNLKELNQASVEEIQDTHCAVNNQ